MPPSHPVRDGFEQLSGDAVDARGLAHVLTAGPAIIVLIALRRGNL